MGDDKPVKVVVSPAVLRKDILEYEDFTGRVEAVERIDLRARVTGYLQKVDFKEGAQVKKGTVLFEIDPAGYKAEYERAVSRVSEANVRVKRLKADFERARVLRANRSISQEEFDKAAGDYNEAAAAVDVAAASQNVAKTNLDWTQVVAPIDGVTGRAMIDPGNLVKADSTILTTIVSLDPIYAYFDIDERTDLHLERLARAGKIEWAKDSKVTVLLALADEDDFTDHVGTINFVDNHLEPTTGTKRVRGVFPNPKRLLSPGQFVRIRLPVGVPHSAIVIPEIAIGSDQGQKFVYVVNRDNEVVYRKIKVGQAMKNYRVVEEALYKLDVQGKKLLVEGLEEGEKVIVNGLQRVRPRIKVDAQVEDVPATAGVSPLPALLRSPVASMPSPASPPSKGAASTP